MVVRPDNPFRDVRAAALEMVTLPPTYWSVSSPARLAKLSSFIVRLPEMQVVPASLKAVKSAPLMILRLPEVIVPAHAVG